jgi:DNA-binding FadR family transcriptional regulator
MSNAQDQAPMSQTDVVVHKIKRMIVNGELRPGDKLPVEGVLAETLGVSRGSLREGVRALSVMGVLQVRQGSGTFVTALDAQLLLAPMEFVVELHSGDVALDLHSVRRVLESEASALAATRMSDEDLDRAEAILAGIDESLAAGTFDEASGLRSDIDFHLLIANASGSPVLATLIEALSSQTIRDRMWRAIAADGVAGTTHHEHRLILAALRDRDTDRARLRMNIHLLEVEDFLRQRPGPPPDALGDFSPASR